MLDTISTILFAVASGGFGDCASAEAAMLMREARPLIVHEEPFLVPRGPVGSAHADVCVRLSFRIASDGSPEDVAVDMSSGERSVDVAARETLKKFRFQYPGEQERKFRWVFYYDHQES